jgi:hypothetical protein
MTEKEVQTETGIEIPPPLISTEPVISTNLMGQLDIVNINKLNLIIAMKTSVHNKLSEIFVLLRDSGKTNIPSNDFHSLLLQAIYACTCKEESHTRFFSFPKRFILWDRTIKKDSHLIREEH